MKRLLMPILALAVLLELAPPGQATTTNILDDTWSTGTRTSQNLPTRSAWFTSGATTNLFATVGTMTLRIDASSYLILTYFTPASNSPPVQLNVGDTLTFNCPGA